MCLPQPAVCSSRQAMISPRAGDPPSVSDSTPNLVGVGLASPPTIGRHSLRLLSSTEALPHCDLLRALAPSLHVEQGPVTEAAGGRTSNQSVVSKSPVRPAIGLVAAFIPTVRPCLSASRMALFQLHATFMQSRCTVTTPSAIPEWHPK
jgi:hypothetical protein